jgi:hypothetical protein
LGKVGFLPPGWTGKEADTAASLAAPPRHPSHRKEGQMRTDALRLLVVVLLLWVIQSPRLEAG